MLMSTADQLYDQACKLLSTTFVPLNKTALFKNMEAMSLSSEVKFNDANRSLFDFGALTDGMSTELNTKAAVSVDRAWGKVTDTSQRQSDQGRHAAWPSGSEGSISMR